jgi:putative ABC transport system permease protein
VSVTPGYFRAMGIPLLAGRDLASGDVLEAPPVVVINAAMARRYWAHRDPVGQRLVVGATVGADARPRTIVGVVGDVRASGLESEPAPALYVSYFQNPWPTMSAIVRTASDPESFAAAVRAQVRALDADQPVYNLRSLDELLGGSLALRRTQARLLGAFTLAALLLAAVGVYGVVAQAVARRTREVGIRMALGAGRGDVMRLVVGRGMRPVAVGLAIGCLGALGASKTLAGLLFGVAPTDAVTFAGSAFVLVVVALVACWLPARRATRVDPVVALRAE